MPHHPPRHMRGRGGGVSFAGRRGVRCRPGYFLPGRVLSPLFRRLFLAGLADAHAAGTLAFFGQLEGLRRREAFAAHLAPLSRRNGSSTSSHPPPPGPKQCSPISPATPTASP